MGADLYIASLYERQRAKWEKRFERAVALRDRLTAGTEAHGRAQQRVERCFDRMRARGYFRDPYNSWDLLWQFRLSWWTDVIPMLDAERYLSVEKAPALLTMLKEREPVFEENLRALKAPDARYFREQYRTFREFLDEAVRLNEAVECSL
jgi:hypothetical protein